MESHRHANAMTNFPSIQSALSYNGFCNLTVITIIHFNKMKWLEHCVSSITAHLWWLHYQVSIGITQIVDHFTTAAIDFVITFTYNTSCKLTHLKTVHKLILYLAT